MSKALARRSKHSRSLGRPRSRHNPAMSPITTGIVVTLLGAGIGAAYQGLTMGTSSIYGGLEQGAALVGIAGLITGLLSPGLRDGAFAVGGVGLVTELLLDLGQGVYAYFQPKTA